MAYKYVIVERDVKVGDEPGTKYYARILRSGTIDANEIVKLISQNCQVSQAAVLGVIKALEMQIVQCVTSGYTVALPSLGTFTPMLNSKAMDTIEEVDASTIRRLKLKFYPSVPLQEALEETHAERANLDIAGLQGLPENDK